MHGNVFAAPAASAAASERSAFLRKVGGYTFVGLSFSMIVGAVAAFGLAMLLPSMPILGNRWVQMGVIFGSFYMTQSVANGMVHEYSTKWIGFFLGTFFQGIAMSYLLLAAVMMSASVVGNPFALVGQAFGLTGLITVGMFAYLLTGPKELSLVKAGLSMLSIPMLILMVISFVFPIGGPIGMVFTGLFVLVSAGGVLYQLNNVMYRYPTNAAVPASYSITIGLLVLYWNLLSLLMRMNRR